jgi:hypothetical protein
MQSWLTMRGVARAEERRFSRVRVVTMQLTDYSRFGVWCSQFTGGAAKTSAYYGSLEDAKELRSYARPSFDVVVTWGLPTVFDLGHFRCLP